MERKCENLLESYMQYTRLLESPDNYHRWSFLAIISACLRRQIWVNMAYWKIFPNMYVVLVGPPGKCRKTVAINAATDLVDDIPDVKISADSITREALIKAIKDSEMMTEIEGKIHLHSSITVVSKELSVFLGSGNHDLLSLLTDLYDCPSKWMYKTKNSGTDDITGVWLSILGASTPTWLVGSIPITAIGGGFTSRVIFVVEEDVRRKTAFPILSPEDMQLRADIKHDLDCISMTRGEFKLDPDAIAFFQNWYDNENVKLEDKRFSGYAERKHIHLMKVAMVVAVARNSKNIITSDHLIEALNYINQVEVRMTQAFGAAGRSTNAQDIDELMQYIKDAKKISRKQLLQSTWHNVPIGDFDAVIKQLVEMSFVKTTIGSDGTSIYYEYIGL